MDVDKLKTSEKQSRSDLTESLQLYNLQELLSVEEVLEGLEIVTDNAKSFRHVHAELEQVLKENYHPQYGEKLKTNMDLVHQYQSDAKAMSKRLRVEENEKTIAKVLAERQEMERQSSRASLIVQIDVLSGKVTDEITEFKLVSPDDIKHSCHRFETLLDECYSLKGKAKAIIPSFDNDHAKDFVDLISKIRKQIAIGKSKISDITSAEKDSLDKAKANDDALSKSEFVKEQKSIANIITEEIDLRSKQIITKCQVTLLDGLDDYQILDRGKKLIHIDTELREVLEKVSEVQKIASGLGTSGQSFLDRTSELREEALQRRNTYAQELFALIQTRDISEEKLKSRDLGIELPKFSGYGSTLDIYSFKAQFEKLVQPNKQRRYWVDILKNNYLSGAAQTLVASVEDIDVAWDKLTSAYGDMRLLLQNKIGALERLGSLDKVRGDEKLGIALAKILNAMIELSTLAVKYNLEYRLYVGGGLEKVLSLLGSEREKRFIKYSMQNPKRPCKSEPAEQELCSEKAEWNSLQDFLEKERALHEKYALLLKSKEAFGIVTLSDKGGSSRSSHNVKQGGLPCHICGQTDHVLSTDHQGDNCVDYFSCKKFVEMSPKERFSELIRNKFCIQCLRPGIKYDESHKCFKAYACPDRSHGRHSKVCHVLVCDTHKNDQANVNLLEKYKTNIISKRSRHFEEFTLNLSLISISSVYLPSSVMGARFANVIPDVSSSAIFLFQTIRVCNITIRLFFDTGCGDIVVRKGIMDKLVQIGRARQEVSNPVTMSGVGDVRSVDNYGVYSVCLPLKDGSNAVFSGVCMDKVTMKFPSYDLTAVDQDIRSQYKSDGRDLNDLPSLPKFVGGETDILIGAKYYYTHPREIFRSKSGLAIFDSLFLSQDGTTGVVLGPHPSFSEAEKSFRKSNPSQNLVCKSYYAPSVIHYRNAYHDMTNNTALGNVTSEPEPVCHLARRTPKCVKTFDEIESAGTEVTYRCEDCRDCENCKKSRNIQAISINDEIEQGLIDRNVTVDIAARKTSHRLPFVVDPDARIDSQAQENLALQIYRGVIKRLDGKSSEKDAIIQSESKLHDLGYVDWLDNLPQKTQDYIRSNVKYTIPWRVVFNQNSVSTPCRLVFDASCAPRGQYCLNSLLAKGTNNLNNMVMIMIRWLCYKFAFHTDISKMYNTVWLDESHWRYQLYYWQEELKHGVEPRPKVIKTAIYGVRPSGNVAESGVRQTAELTKETHPLAYDAITKQLYVDDGMSGADTESGRTEKAEQLSGALGMGGFKLKGFTMSGSDPPPNLANDDQISVNVGGLIWFSKVDELSVKIPELNFGKKQRGKKSQNSVGILPKDLTFRNCLSVVYEIFDPLGRVAPLVSAFKLDIRELHLRKFGWDDVLPDNLRTLWASNIDMIQEIRNIRYRRAVIPEDAVELNCDTIDTADASPDMICVAIYIRFKLKSGKHSCQLLFSRTKTVPQDMSQPRAEMLACSLNASTGHIVKTALGDLHTGCVKLTDSQVALFWIDSVRSKLKMWVRNHCIHINRLAPRDLWAYVKSSDMIADIGTRKGATIKDIGPESPWINGLPWMSGPSNEFPIKSVNDILLVGERKGDMLKECIASEAIEGKTCHSVVCIAHDKLVPEAVGNRYRFSKYVIDPNKFRFRTVVRILGYVLQFIRNARKATKRDELSVTINHVGDLPGGVRLPSEDARVATTGSDDMRFMCTKGLVVDLDPNMTNAALQYFFKKASVEVKHFLPVSKYKNISEEKSGILFYTGRILPTQGISCKQQTLCDVCLDLMKDTFCVPIIDALSPIAYSIADEIHWYHPDVKHGGIESALRETYRTAFIVGGRELLKMMKFACARCRFLYKQEVKVAMGPKHDSNLCIAPAFFNTQVDLCGPFDSYSNVNKRAKVKVYMAIFCCSTTGATDCKVMEDYSTDSFILSFIRFACRYGYPSSMYPDAGSQLLKGCSDMVLSFSTIKYKLEVEFGVQFQPCPVGAHYVHGKVERKIREVRKSIAKNLHNERLSIIQWETLAQQIANSINNLPIGVANRTNSLENIDLITPNRLLLGRNNNRCPTSPLMLSGDVKKIIKSNHDIFTIWFRSWLVSYVPSLIPQPKWFETGRHIALGDVVLFSKSDKEFEDVYQFGIISKLHPSRDGLIRKVDVTYQNHSERTKRVAKSRCIRELIVIHPVEEVGISRELHDLATGSTNMCSCCL